VARALRPLWMTLRPRAAQGAVPLRPMSPLEGRSCELELLGLRQFLAEPDAARALTEAAIALSQTHEFAYYLAWAEIIHEWALS
jgi:hypothetical protein